MSVSTRGAGQIYLNDITPHRVEDRENIIHGISDAMTWPHSRWKVKGPLWGQEAMLILPTDLEGDKDIATRKGAKTVTYRVRSLWHWQLPEFRAFVIIVMVTDVQCGKEVGKKPQDVDNGQLVGGIRLQGESNQAPALPGPAGARHSTPDLSDNPNIPAPMVTEKPRVPALPRVPRLTHYLFCQLLQLLDVGGDE